MNKPEYYIVGIGSSAGGLEAYQQLLPHLPENDACYIICQHLSPHHKSMLSEILSRSTSMTVTDLSDGVKLKAKQIYVTPPNTNIDFEEGIVKLIKISNQSLPKPNINQFLTALGQTFGDRSIGIILSGSGSDGAMGLQAIQASGGMTIAQSPDSASYDSMPYAAIQSNVIDFIGKPKEIGQHLKQYVTKVRPKENEVLESKPYTTIIKYLSQVTQIDFSGYRPTTISRRLLRRMAILRLNTLDDYLKYLQEHDSEVSAFVQDAFIHVSSFFRDRKSFDSFGKAITEFLSDQPDLNELRIWVPGCAAGQEAFTIAMMVDDILDKNEQNICYKVFATDIAKNAITQARSGIFSLDQCQNIPTQFRQHYCFENNSTLEVKPKIRESVVFSVHNLLDDPPFSRVHIISCRNLLIYLNPTLQEDLCQLFNYALVKHGLLFLGSAETLRNPASFKTLDENHKLYKKQDDDLGRPKIIRFKSVKSTLPFHLHPKTQEFNLEAETLNRLSSLYAPTSIVIDNNNHIIYTKGDIEPFLTKQEGINHQNLVDRVLPELRAELRALIFKVRRTHDQAVGSPRDYKIKNQPGILTAAVSYFHRDKPDWIIVSFIQAHRKPTSTDIAYGQFTGSELVVGLEQELTATRENLQTVIEELETANEQLQVYNQELQSSNEEYQSTNEELQTVNEELQSTNEELVTVNDELKEKGQEQERLTTDIFNIQESLDVPMFVLDMEFRIKRMTNRCALLADVSRVRIEDIFFSIPWLHEMPELREPASKALVKDGAVEHEHTIGGNTYRCRISPYINNEKRRDGIVVAFYDITSLKQTQSALALEKDIAQMTLASLSEGVIRLNESFNVEYINPAAEKLLQWDSDKVIDGPVDRYLCLYENKEQIDLQAIIKKCREGGHRFAPKDTFYTIKTRFGEERLTELTITPINSGEVLTSTRALITFKDVTERQAHLDQLLWSSKHDALTGLVNRKEVETRITKTINYARNSGQESTLLYLDLDQFKIVNDTCGHMAGDQLLKQIAQLIHQHIRSRDTLARLGGDEFSILFENCRIYEAEKIASTILESVSNYTFSWDAKVFKIGISIGVVSINSETESVSSVLSDADAACYAAKEQGRNRIQIHSKHNDLLEQQRSQMSIVADINDALENSRFRVYFQEIASLNNQHASSWEALVRMFNKEGDFLMPTRFLPAAERFGVITRVDRWVLRHVLSSLATYFSARYLPEININVSAHTVNDDTYLNTAENLIQEYGLPPEKICFELTETAAMSNLIKTKEFIKRANGFGCLVALDDFGTGTSSLAYLKELPVNSVKIDGLFTNSVGKEDVNHYIVEAITHVAHHLNMSVVAECVESSEQMEDLGILGVNFAQGYAIRRPIPLEEFVSYNHEEGSALSA